MNRRHAHRASDRYERAQMAAFLFLVLAVLAAAALAAPPYVV